MKRLLQSEDFSAEAEDEEDDNLEVGKISPVKGSTTFRVTSNTPGRIESDFCIGGGKHKWMTKASNMERVSKMFEDFDDDLVPRDNEIDTDIVEEDDIVDNQGDKDAKDKIPKEISILKPQPEPEKKVKTHAKFKLLAKPVKSKDNRPPMLSPGKKRREMDNTYEIDETKLSASSYKRQCNSENKNNTLVNQITFDTLSKLLTEDKQT